MEVWQEEEIVSSGTEYQSMLGSESMEWMVPVVTVEEEEEEMVERAGEEKSPTV